MFRILSEEELLKSFRPRDQRTLELPRKVKFPLFVRDYLAWTDETGVRTHLVFSLPGSKRPVGISFRRDQQGAHAAGSRICDWCHSYGSADEIGLLTAEASSKRRLGVSLCMDLRCAEKLESYADRSGRSFRELARTLTERMSRFVKEGLGIREVPEH